MTEREHEMHRPEHEQQRSSSAFGGAQSPEEQPGYVYYSRSGGASFREQPERGSRGEQSFMGRGREQRGGSEWGGRQQRGGFQRGESQRGGFQRGESQRSEFQLRCADMMTPNPRCCQPSDMVDRVAQLMQHEDAGSIPVIQNQQNRRLIGIVTDRDLALKVVASGQDPRRVAVGDVMTHHPVACHPDDDLEQALEAMAEYQVRRIPVVDDNDRIVGIIAQADIVTRLGSPRRANELIEEISRPSEAQFWAGPGRQFRPRRSSRSQSNNNFMILGGIALGFAFAYFFDVERGQQRREQLFGQFKQVTEQTRSMGQGKDIEIQKSIIINAPVSEVFSFWRNFSNFPQFMSNLIEVRDLGNGRSHWVAKGPANVPVEWDAVITQSTPNQVLAWQSEAGSLVSNSGRVHFQQINNSTQVNIRLSYRPPAGAIGHAVARLFGADPKSEMDEDLERLKTLLETGQTKVGGETVTRGQVETGRARERGGQESQRG